MTGFELRAELQRLLGQRRPDRAWDRAARLCVEGTSEEQSVARYYLPHLASRLPGSAWSEERRSQAQRVRVRPSEAARHVGRVDFPVIGGPADRFLSAQVRKLGGSGPDEIETVAGGALPEDTRAAVSVALDAARRHCENEQGLRVLIDEPVEGRSLGLAVAVAAISCLRDVPVPDKIAATGRVTRTGAVEQVDHMEAKLRLRAEARPGCTLLVPVGLSQVYPGLHPAADIAEAGRCIGADPSVDLEATLDGIYGAQQRGDWPEAARRAHPTVDDPDLTDDHRVKLLTILLTAANHSGNHGEAEARSAAVKRALHAQVPVRTAVLAIASCAVAAIDVFRADLALAALSSAEALAGQSAPEDRIHLRGAEALLSILSDRLDRALELRRENVSQSRKDERPRCLADLADVQLRRGKIDEATATVAEALSALSAAARIRAGYVRQTSPYLHLTAARICRRRGRHDEALEHLHMAGEPQGPDPRIRLALERELLTSGLAGVDRLWLQHPALHEARIFQALFLRARVECEDRDAAQRLAHLMRLPADTTSEQLCRRLPY